MAVGRQNSSRDDLGQGYGRGRGGRDRADGSALRRRRPTPLPPWPRWLGSSSSGEKVRIGGDGRVGIRSRRVNRPRTKLAVDGADARLSAAQRGRAPSLEARQKAPGLTALRLAEAPVIWPSVSIASDGVQRIASRLLHRINYRDPELMLAGGRVHCCASACCAFLWDAYHRRGKLDAACIYDLCRGRYCPSRLVPAPLRAELHCRRTHREKAPAARPGTFPVVRYPRRASGRGTATGTLQGGG